MESLTTQRRVSLLKLPMLSAERFRRYSRHKYTIRLIARRGLCASYSDLNSPSNTFVLLGLGMSHLLELQPLKFTGLGLKGVVLVTHYTTPFI